MVWYKAIIVMARRKINGNFFLKKAEGTKAEGRRGKTGKKTTETRRHGEKIVIK